MPASIHRRNLVKALGAGLVWASRPGRAVAAPRRRGTAGLAPLADRILATPREKVFELVEPLLRDGLPWEDLQGALFVAGIREVEPRPVGNKLHSVLAIESVFQLLPGGSPAEYGMGVLWNLDEIKHAQERDVGQGNWTLPPPPDVSFSSRAAAEREVHAAFLAHDEERTDRAVTGLLAFAGRAEVMEVLFPYAMREHVGLCHRTIFAAHVDRTVARVGEEHFGPAVRSLVHGLFEARPGPTLAHYTASEKAADTLRAGWTKGECAPGRSLAIARDVRSATPDDARDRVLGELNAGLDPSTLWDALRLVAADLFARGPGLLAVHATTVTNALYHVFRTTRSDATRRITLLQAAAWMPLFRERFIERHRFRMTAGEGLDAVLLEEGPSPERIEASIRAHLFRGVDQNHQTKYAAAALEEARWADPRWRRALLAPALAYLPDEDSPTTDLGSRSRALVARLAR